MSSKTISSNLPFSKEVSACAVGEAAAATVTATSNTTATTTLLVLCCLLVLTISNNTPVVVYGLAFAPQELIPTRSSISAAPRTRTLLGLLSISQDAAALPSPASPPSPLLSSIRVVSQNNEYTNAFPSSNSKSFEQKYSLGSTSTKPKSTSTTTTALLAMVSSSSDSSEDGRTATTNNNMDNNNSRKEIGTGTNKQNFFASLDTTETLNGATKQRSSLLAKMIDEKRVVTVGSDGGNSINDEGNGKETASTTTTIIPTISYEKPGSSETFLATAASNADDTAAAAGTGTAEQQVAVGTWRVIYAPHMTTAMDLFRGRFDVSYELFSDRTIVSHAYYDFPIVGKGYLSVSGTYGSVPNDATDTYSRVDFNKAWVKSLSSSSESAAAAAAVAAKPYDSLEDVPDSFLKTAINEVGKRAFVESVAVFPVSFLDDDTIVFKFETLGTKICAHKM